MNGLLARIKKLEQSLNMEKVDVAMIDESHLISSSYAKIPNYNLYSSNHPGGGLQRVRFSMFEMIFYKIKSNTSDTTILSRMCYYSTAL